MTEVTCPHCGEVFTLGEAEYGSIAKQVRDREFEREVAARSKLISDASEARESVAVAQARQEAEKRLAESERSRAELSASLKALEESSRAARELDVAEARDALSAELAKARGERDELKVRLEAQADQAASRQELAVRKALDGVRDQVREAEQERDSLRARVERDKADMEHLRAAHKAEMETKLRLKDEEIAVREREIEDMRHLRAGLSTKMVGESLEQFCENEFNKLRATGFQRAYFEKDNDATGGSKGDYIYRELDESGEEVVSIMFEMKHEEEGSVHRKRNDAHFKKLDHDRTAKKCEYAVLVSTLERYSDLYNSGIVDVSFSSGYDKMYVVRPQFFIPIITLVRNAALRSLEYRRELAAMRQQNIDVTNFEDKLADFKQKFGSNFDLASRKYHDAIKDIDQAIAKLEKIKRELTSSENALARANKRLDGLTVKRLVWRNPTMKAKFAEAAERAAQDAGPNDDDGEEVLEAEVLDD